MLSLHRFMTLEHNISLKPYNTFGIDAKAKDFVAIHNHQDLMDLLASGLLQEEPFLIVGGGSNLVFTSDYEGLVILMRNQHYEKVSTNVVKAEAGVVMDELIHWCVSQELYGMENLVAIPGTVGASVVQNVGAYGVEAKDIVEEVCAYDVATGEQHLFTNADCEFDYRWSVFKGALSNRYIIEWVTYHLSTQFNLKVSYQGLEKALQQAGLTAPSATDVLDLITDVRWNKLPNPKDVGSAGSFFQNPIVSHQEHQRLKSMYPDMVTFELPNNQYKLAAGWLIEHAGWKGKTLGHAGVWSKQALVLVNADGQASGDDVQTLATAIVNSVKETYGVELHREAIYV